MGPENKLNTTCNIYLQPNLQRIQKDGTVRLYIMISISRTDRSKVKLPISWPVNCFDNNKKQINPRFDNDPDYVAFSAIIENEKAKYWRVVKRMLLQDRVFTTADIFQGVNTAEIGKGLCAYIVSRSKQREREREIKSHTGDNHRATSNILKIYSNRDPEISEIGKKYLDKFLTWLMKNQGLEYSSAWTHIKNIRTYVNDARRRDLQIHPTFKDHKLVKPESEPVWLDRSELDKLLEFYNDPLISEANFVCLRSFLFNCFFGMRISDLKRFNVSWIQNGEVIFTPVKSKITDRKKREIRIPIIDTAEQFLRNLDNSNIFIRSEQKHNQRLKTIAQLAGIEKKLTSHVARHTFATILAINGTPILIIAKLMGHETTKSTMIYIHIAEQARQHEMLRLQNAFAGFIVHKNAG